MGIVRSSPPTGLAAPTGVAELRLVRERSGEHEADVGPAGSAPARDDLRRTAAAVDACAGTGQTDPGAGLELWRGLVEGRWTLVDRFESDGRCCLIARRSDPKERVSRALTRREQQVVAFVGRGQSNKLVAWSLGLTESTVATHLTSARRKLGVRGRAELIALMAALCDPHEPEAQEPSAATSVPAM